MKKGHPPQPEVKEAVVSKVLAALSIGISVTVAVKSANISTKTWWLWIKKDPELKKRHYKAIADSEISLVARVQHHAKDEYRAAIWLLSRRFPKRWGDPVRKAEETAPASVTVRAVVEVPPRMAESQWVEAAKDGGS